MLCNYNTESNCYIWKYNKLGAFEAFKCTEATLMCSVPTFSNVYTVRGVTKHGLQHTDYTG